MTAFDSTAAATAAAGPMAALATEQRLLGHRIDTISERLDVALGEQTATIPRRAFQSCFLVPLLG